MSEPTVAVFHRTTITNRALTLLAATRPAFLTASMLPVLASGALAYGQSGGKISLVMLSLAVINIILIHAGANVLNDYFDARNGSDGINKDRIFPFTGGSRFIQNEVLDLRETWNYGMALMLAGGLLGLYMVSQVGLPLLVLGITGALLAWFYSAPPCLACKGLGDLVIATCFGILPVIGTSTILLGYITEQSWWLGAIIGCFVSAILWINSIPDIRADRIAGKMTLPARLGPRKALWGLPVLFALGYGLLLISPLPRYSLLALASVVPALLASRAMVQNRLIPAIPLTLITHAAACTLLIIGLLLSC